VRNLLISRKVDMPVLKQTNVIIRVFLYFSKDAPHKSCGRITRMIKIALSQIFHQGLFYLVLCGLQECS